MIITNKELKKRIIDISYKHKLSHIGSCLTAVDLIVDIYQKSKKGDKFVLSQGHAGVALYVVLESAGLCDAEVMLDKGIHPDRINDPYDVIDCSTGSLGWGVSIAYGMALANPDITVRCLTSDGEITEGVVYETMLIAERYPIENIEYYININGYTGLDQSREFIYRDLFKVFSRNVYILPERTNVDDFFFLQGLDGHYHIMTDRDYKVAKEVLK